MTRKALCVLVGTGVMGLLVLLGWMLYLASPAAEAQTSALLAAGGSADLKIVDQYVEAPAEIPLSEDVPIDVRKVIHNNGPHEPVDAQVLGTPAAPEGCDISPGSHLEQIYNLPVSVDVTIREPFTIHCYEPSWHTFTFDNVLEVTTVGVEDPDPSNNTWHTDWTVAAVTEADLEVVSQTVVDWPTKIFASVDVPVTLEAEVRNNGPYGPVDAELQGWLSPPSGCTAHPSPAVEQVVLAASETKAVQQEFTIHCLTGGLRTFTLTNRVESKDPHIGDPDLANNERSRWLPSFYVEDNTDVKIISQSLVNAPTQIAVSENVDVTLHKVIHNNGPAGPIDVSISSTATAPAGCSVTAKSVPTSIPQVPVSVDQTVDEIWTIHCAQASTHSFTFDNSVATILTDLYPDNNSASTPLTVDVVAEADVEIVGQQVLAGDCTGAAPAEIGVSENTGICLRKTLHNKGPFGPVDVSISTSAAAPGDCSAIPDGGNLTSASLPVSTDVVVDEIWTVHCATPSSHSLSFENAIAVTNPHVTDPDEGNNAASTELAVDAIAEADVKISGQELVDPPTEIDVSQDVSLTLRKHLHNNGPYGPVEVSISPSASAPPGCTATFEGGSASTSTAYQASAVSGANGATLVVGYDMNPIGNSCPGDGATDCTLGDIDTCVEVPSGGGVISIDVFLDGLPQLPIQPYEGGISSFQYHIGEKDGLAVGTIAGFTHKSTAFNLLVQEPTIMFFEYSEPIGSSVPSWDASAAELGDTEFNPPYTKGVLSRVELNVTAADGIYGLTLDSVIVGDVAANDYCEVGSPNYVGCDTKDANATPEPYGLIAIGVSCAPEPTPTPTPTPTPAPTPTPTPTPPPGIILLPVSVDTAVDESWTIHCSEPSTHSFSFDNVIAITSAHVSDSNQANNSASAGLTVDAIAQADVKVVGVSVVDPPGEINVSEDVSFTVRSTLHNNGSYGPVGVEILETVTSPLDCDISPSEPLSRQVDLPASVDVTVDEPFTIHCSEKSTHTFTFETEIVQLKDPHVLDPVSTNNSGSTQLTVEAWGIADLKIVDQHVVNPPAEVPLSEDVQITLHQVIHNNGPYEPADAVTETLITVPPDCTVQPTTHVQEFHNVPFSVDIVHHAPFTIHCYQVSTHEFVFDSQVTVSNTHLRDPNPGNDTASTDLVLVSVAQADVKIVSVGFVNPPTKIPKGQDVDITLRKHIHNNGPRDPVDITIDASAAAPTGCTIVAKSVPSSLSDVPVSVDQVVDEVWTIRCTEEGLKTFVFDNSIDVATVHVYDPEQANNASHKLLTVRDDSYPYWGDDICDGKDNDGNTVIDEGWDLNGNTIADCLDPALDTDGDGLTNDVDDDDDGDGWTDEDEGFIRTDPLSFCPLDAYHDAWPPDINNNGVVNILDIVLYRGPIRGAYDRRYDLNTDGRVNILDIVKFRPVIRTSCTL